MCEFVTRGVNDLFGDGEGGLGDFESGLFDCLRRLVNEYYAIDGACLPFCAASFSPTIIPCFLLILGTCWVDNKHLLFSLCLRSLRVSSRFWHCQDLCLQHPNPLYEQISHKSSMDIEEAYFALRQLCSWHHSRRYRQSQSYGLGHLVLSAGRALCY